MDNKAFYKLSYGVFMLSTKLGDKVNGCITNTCIQVANSPTRLSVAVLNSNYTCELMKESGIFNVSVLDKRCNFDIIKHIVEYTEEKNDKHEISYNVVTNLTLLNDDILEFLTEHRFGISTSIVLLSV